MQILTINQEQASNDIIQQVINRPGQYPAINATIEKRKAEDIIFNKQGEVPRALIHKPIHTYLWKEDKDGKLKQYLPKSSQKLREKFIKEHNPNKKM